MNESFYVLAYSEIGALVFEEEADSHEEAMEIAEALMGEYEVVIHHPDGHEETF